MFSTFSAEGLKSPRLLFGVGSGRKKSGKKQGMRGTCREEK